MGKFIEQPVPKPATISEYLEIRHLLIDTHGRPLELVDCDGCRCPHYSVEPHLYELACPTCGSTARRCRRPSGHEAQTWHQSRVDLREWLIDARAEDGRPVVAPWPAAR